MASIIRIKRSEVSGNPSSLGAGELAYSALVDNGANGGDRLYIGMGTETDGNAVNHVVIGGKYFTDMLDHNKGTLTASSALIVDADSKLDNLKVDNLDLNGNTISSTDTNGNIVITPNGVGKTVIGNVYVGDASTSLTQYIQNVTGGAVVAGEGIDVTVDSGAGTTTISAEVATSSNLGIATFNTASFTVTNGDVTIKSGGVTNTQLVNSSLTLGSTSIALGATATSLTGLTDLTVDNISINGNTISSTDTNGNITINPDGTGIIDVSGTKITNLAEPTSPSDAATKNYVDNALSGLTWKQAVNLLADTNVALTGTTMTLTIDGHAVLDSDDNNIYRILLTNQSVGSENGIYLYTDDGTSYTLVRSSDADTYDELVGLGVYVLEGTTYANTGWVQSNHYLTSFANQQWVQFSGAGAYTAGAGLGQSGTSFFINVASNSGIEIVADAIQLKSTLAGPGLTYSTGVLTVGGTDDRITVGNDTIDIASTYVGQTSITTLGTITIGTWSADTIGVTKGGTGLTSITSRGIMYGNGTSNVGVTAASSIDGSFLREDSTGAPYWSNTMDGGTY